MPEVTEFRPKIVAFCCNWCSYAGADLAGSGRMAYPADVKIIRVPCSCRVNPMFILRAFQRGADGVILCGCHPGGPADDTVHGAVFQQLDGAFFHYFLHLRSSSLRFSPRFFTVSTNSFIVLENLAPSAAEIHSTRVRSFSMPR